MSELQLDEVLHVYTLSGRVIPGVSEILKDCGLIKYGGAGSELENNHAMSRGRAVHQACHYLDEGDLQWETVQDEILPYVLGYEKFKKETGFTPHRIEEKLLHPVLAFAGTIDREGVWQPEAHKGRVVLEIKTGAPASWWGLQLTGYDLLLPTLSKPRERWAVQLQDDATYKLHPFRDTEDKNLFLSAVGMYWWKRNKNA